MPDFKVNIDPEDVNKAIAQAIIDSMLGEYIQEAIVKSLREFNCRYNNPVLPIVEREVNRITKEVLQEKYADKIKAMIVEKMDEGKVTEIAQKAIDNIGIYKESERY